MRQFLFIFKNKWSTEMRAPEFLLIDRLEQLKNELKDLTPTVDIVDITLSEYQGNPFFAHESNLSENNKIINRIQLSKQELPENLTRRIKQTQDELRSLISNNKYPELIQTIDSRISQETQLLLDIESGINLISALRSQFQPTIANSRITQEYLFAHLEVSQKKEAFLEHAQESMRILLEFFGTNRQKTDLGSVEGLRMRSIEESRFGIIDKILNQLISEMNRLQVAAGESVSNFDLKIYVHEELREKLYPFETGLISVENHLKLRALLQKLATEEAAFNTHCEEIRLQRQSLTTSTTSSATFFRPSNDASARRNDHDENASQARSSRNTQCSVLQ